MSDPALTRRRLLLASAGTLVAASAAAGLACDSDSKASQAARLPSAKSGLPAAQHEWDATLASDRFGNRRAPRHHRLIILKIEGDGSVEQARALESALRRIENDLPYGPAGVLTAVGWGPSWFARIGVQSPIPKPQPLADTEVPDLEDIPALVHLASDDPAALESAERIIAASGLGISGRRAGTNGTGLARRSVGKLELPPGVLPPADSPLMMGFESGRKSTQARESDIIIADGRWAGATTMHVSEIALTLPSWYRALSEQERVERMFGPGIEAEAVLRPGPGIEPPNIDPARSASRHGYVGHAAAAASVRRAGRPLILRRDFNGVVDSQPVTHFVSYQASIEDFVATRRAINADAAVGVNGVDQVINNGINEWISVRKRANLLVPTRSRRSFPGLPGWDE